MINLGRKFSKRRSCKIDKYIHWEDGGDCDDGNDQAKQIKDEIEVYSGRLSSIGDVGGQAKNDEGEQ